MRFTPTGDVLLGLGDGRVSLNGRDLARGGKPIPFDATTAVYQDLTDGSSALGWLDMPTGQCRRGARMEITTLRAGAGVWAVFAAGRGVTTNTGYVAAEDVILDVGPDGWLYVTEYQNPVRIRVYQLIEGAHVLCDEFDSGGSFFQDNFGLTFRALSGGRCVWLDGRLQLHAQGLTVVPPTWTTYGAVPVVVQDRVFLVELGNRRLTCRPADQLAGWIVADQIDTWSPDAIAREGQIHVGWSATSGERPQDGRTAVVDPQRAPVPLVVAVTPPVPSPPIVTPSPAPTPQPSALPPEQEPDSMPLPKRIAFAAAPMGMGGILPTDQVGLINPLPDGTHFTVTWGPNDKGHVPVNPDTVLSVQPDGTYQTRPKGTAAQYETFRVSGNLLVVWPNWNGSGPIFPQAPSTPFAIPFVVLE